MLVARGVVNSLFVFVILVSKETGTTVQVGFIMSFDLANIPPTPKKEIKTYLFFFSNRNRNEINSIVSLLCTKCRH